MPIKKPTWPEEKYNLETMTLVSYDMNRVLEKNPDSELPKNLAMRFLSCKMQADIIKECKKEYEIKSKRVLYGFQGNYKEIFTVNSKGELIYHIMNNKKFNEYHLDILIQKEPQDLHDTIHKIMINIKTKYEGL